MIVKKKEKLHIKLSYKEALKIRNEFGELKGVKDNMETCKSYKKFRRLTGYSI